ncbi:hypothetical protein TR13x_05225 [Caloranaerobacter sp. TR13]|uniref:hypothetical protein n=1 Tax=Caloranaerobacter sp. TR13 TaxID=1302151 RepID=UPI0006D413C2|nr:hypothetical protein [Caloranaerobacter sp. TR13]KPU27472.1 hypothetical protein TR13x_05225 [Caloranaerobacter sp. TR13]
MIKNGKQKVKGIILKVMGFLTGGTLISMVLLINMDTYSWFTSKMTYNLSVTAATTEDILEKIEIKTVNPKEIVLKKNNSINIEPVIYFSVEGEASDYILHINPIKLKNHKKYTVPINVAVNLKQIIELLNKDNENNNKRVQGTIRIKYLNEFIDEKIDIEFTTKYLFKKFLERLSIRCLNEENEFEIEKHLRKVIMHIDKQARLQSSKFYEKETVAEEIYGSE